MLQLTVDITVGDFYGDVVNVAGIGDAVQDLAAVLLQDYEVVLTNRTEGQLLGSGLGEGKGAVCVVGSQKHGSGAGGGERRVSLEKAEGEFAGLQLPSGQLLVAADGDGGVLGVIGIGELSLGDLVVGTVLAHDDLGGDSTIQIVNDLNGDVVDLLGVGDAGNVALDLRQGEVDDVAGLDLACGEDRQLDGGLAVGVGGDGVAHLCAGGIKQGEGVACLADAGDAAVGSDQLADVDADLLGGATDVVGILDDQSCGGRRIVQIGDRSSSGEGAGMVIGNIDGHQITVGIVGDTSQLAGNFLDYIVVLTGGVKLQLTEGEHTVGTVGDGLQSAAENVSCAVGIEQLEAEFAGVQVTAGQMLDAADGHGDSIQIVGIGEAGSGDGSAAFIGDGIAGFDPAVKQVFNGDGDGVLLGGVDHVRVGAMDLLQSVGHGTAHEVCTVGQLQSGGADIGGRAQNGGSRGSYQNAVLVIQAEGEACRGDAAVVGGQFLTNGDGDLVGTGGLVRVAEVGDHIPVAAGAGDGGLVIAGVGDYGHIQLAGHAGIADDDIEIADTIVVGDAVGAATGDLQDAVVGGADGSEGGGQEAGQIIGLGTLGQGGLAEGVPVAVGQSLQLHGEGIGIQPISAGEVLGAGEGDPGGAVGRLVVIHEGQGGGGAFPNGGGLGILAVDLEAGQAGQQLHCGDLGTGGDGVDGQRSAGLHGNGGLAAGHGDLTGGGVVGAGDRSAAGIGQGDLKQEILACQSGVGIAGGGDGLGDDQVAGKIVCGLEGVDEVGFLDFLGGHIQGDLLQTLGAVDALDLIDLAGGLLGDGVAAGGQIDDVDALACVQRDMGYAVIKEDNRVDRRDLGAVGGVVDKGIVAADAVGGDGEGEGLGGAGHGLIHGLGDLQTGGGGHGQLTVVAQDHIHIVVGAFAMLNAGIEDIVQSAGGVGVLDVVISLDQTQDRALGDVPAAAAVELGSLQRGGGDPLILGRDDGLAGGSVHDGEHGIGTVVFPVGIGSGSAGILGIIGAGLDVDGAVLGVVVALVLNGGLKECDGIHCGGGLDRVAFVISIIECVQIIAVGQEAEAAVVVAQDAVSIGGQIRCGDLFADVQSVDVGAQAHFVDQTDGIGTVHGHGDVGGVLDAVAFQGNVVGNNRDQGCGDLPYHGQFAGGDLLTDLDGDVHHIRIPVAVLHLAQHAVGLHGVDCVGGRGGGAFIVEADVLAAGISIPADVVAEFAGSGVVAQLSVIEGKLDQIPGILHILDAEAGLDSPDELITQSGGVIQGAEGGIVGDKVLGKLSAGKERVAQLDAFDLNDIHIFA